MKLNSIKNLALGITALSLIACGGEAAEEEQAVVEETPVVEEAPKANCKLASYTYKLVDIARTLTFAYEGDQLTSVNSETKGEELMAINYTYNEAGKIASFTSGDNVATYVYNEGGLLTEITGAGNLMTRKFEYDNKRNMIKQTTLLGTEPFMTIEYRYDGSAAPIKSTVFDQKGTAVEENTFLYDNANNPFRNMGGMVNTFEMLYGYPVGNNGNNIVSISTTYLLQNTTKPSVQKMQFEYDENGYPTGVMHMRNEESFRSEMSYTCE